jgi:hypothetical protein
MQGATGVQGPAGATGPVGSAGGVGPTGISILTGAGAPSPLIGMPGDTYIDVCAGVLYGPQGVVYTPSYAVGTWVR